MMDEANDYERPDPIAMAGFLVLPGAARVMHAFARIPPGRLRASAINHLEAMAQEYGDPTDARNFNPFDGLGQAQVAAQEPIRALPAPPPGTKPQLSAEAAETPEMKAVIHMMNGVMPADAAQLTGLSIAEVNDARARAKKQGVTFPKMRMTQIVTGTPVREKAPGKSTLDKAGGFPITEKEVKSAGALKHMQSSADRLGVSLGIFFELRKRTLDLLRAGQVPSRIASTLGIDRQTVANWTFRIRASGLLQSTSGDPPPAPKSKHNATFPLSEDQVTPMGRRQVMEAVAAMGATVEDYFRKRRRAVALLTAQDFTARELAEDLGIPVKTAQGWKTNIVALGLNKQMEPAE